MCGSKFSFEALRAPAYACKVSPPVGAVGMHRLNPKPPLRQCGESNGEWTHQGLFGLLCSKTLLPLEASPQLVSLHFDRSSQRFGFGCSFQFRLKLVELFLKFVYLLPTILKHPALPCRARQFCFLRGQSARRNRA